MNFANHTQMWPCWYFIPQFLQLEKAQEFPRARRRPSSPSLTLTFPLQGAEHSNQSPASAAQLSLGLAVST